MKGVYIDKNYVGPEAGSPEYQKTMEYIMKCPKCRISMKTVSTHPKVPEFSTYECPKCGKCLMG